MNLTLWQSQFRTWLETRHYSVRTTDSYSNELDPLLAWLTVVGVESIADIRREHLEGYRGGAGGSRPPPSRIDCLP
jgi:site-specific recombinase XerD